MGHLTKVLGQIPRHFQSKENISVPEEKQQETSDSGASMSMRNLRGPKRSSKGWPRGKEGRRKSSHSATSSQESTSSRPANMVAVTDTSMTKTPAALASANRGGESWGDQQHNGDENNTQSPFRDVGEEYMISADSFKAEQAEDSISDAEEDDTELKHQQPWKPELSPSSQPQHQITRPRGSSAGSFYNAAAGTGPLVSNASVIPASNSSPALPPLPRAPSVSVEQAASASLMALHESLHLANLRDPPSRGSSSFGNGGGGGRVRNNSGGAGSSSSRRVSRAESVPGRIESPTQELGGSVMSPPEASLNSGHTITPETILGSSDRFLIEATSRSYRSLFRQNSDVGGTKGTAAPTGSETSTGLRSKGNKILPPRGSRFLGSMRGGLNSASLSRHSTSGSLVKVGAETVEASAGAPFQEIRQENKPNGSDHVCGNANDDQRRSSETSEAVKLNGAASAGQRKAEGEADIRHSGPRDPRLELKWPGSPMTSAPSKASYGTNTRSALVLGGNGQLTVAAAAVSVRARFSGQTEGGGEGTNSGIESEFLPGGGNIKASTDPTILFTPEHSNFGNQLSPQLKPHQHQQIYTMTEDEIYPLTCGFEDEDPAFHDRHYKRYRFAHQKRLQEQMPQYRKLFHRIQSQALARGDEYYDPVVAHRDGLTLYWSDVRNLEEGEWLSDTDLAFAYEHLEATVLARCERRGEVVLLRPALAYLLQHAPETAEELASALPDFGSARFVFLPINDNPDVSASYGGTHWSLLVVSTRDHKAMYYDTLHDGVVTAAAHRTADRLAAVMAGRAAPGHRPRKLSMICVPTPRQVNGSDCGVLVAEITALLLRRLVEATEARQPVNLGMEGVYLLASAGRTYLLSQMLLLIEDDERRSGNKLPVISVTGATTATAAAATTATGGMEKKDRGLLHDWREKRSSSGSRSRSRSRGSSSDTSDTKSASPGGHKRRWSLRHKMKTRI